MASGLIAGAMTVNRAYSPILGKDSSNDTGSNDEVTVFRSKIAPTKSQRGQAPLHDGLLPVYLPLARDQSVP